MSYRVEQIINNTTYVYETTSYWDKQKKQPRQHRVCIGKKDPKTGKLIPSKSKTQPRLCKDFGNAYLLQSIVERIGLISILQKTFPDIWQEILACVFFEVSERKPLYLCESWSETTDIAYPINLSSQRISDLLKMIGNRDKERMEFFRAWAAKRAEHEYLAFDITSISSYSQRITQIEYGYNRDGDSLGQINLGMVFGQTSLLPIYYQLYPGSIHDVNTLHNMIAYTEHLNVKTIRYILDKGFYSQKNIMDMLKKRIQFAVALPFTTNLASRLSNAVRRTINHSAHSFMFNDDILYAHTKTIRYGRNRLKAFIYYNERQYLEAKEALLKKILALETIIKENQSVKGMDHAYLKYLLVRKTKSGPIVQHDETAIETALRNKGYFIIVSNAVDDMQEALALYRSKDSIEKAFDNLKNELDLKRLRVHSDMAMAGRLFIAFLALILYSWISRRMKETTLNQKWTQEELMMEMKKLKRVELNHNNKLFTELTKNQKLIFQSFQIPLPK